MIDRLAPHGDPKAVKFLPAQIKHRDRRGRKDGKAKDSEADHISNPASSVVEFGAIYPAVHYQACGIIGVDNRNVFL